MVHHQIAHHTALDLQFLDVGLPFDLTTAMELCLIEHAGLLEHTDALRRQVTVNNHRHTRLAVQTAFGCFTLPLLTIAVTVKTDRLAGNDIFLDNIKQDTLFRFAFLDALIDLVLEEHQLLRYGGIEG